MRELEEILRLALAWRALDRAGGSGADSALMRLAAALDEIAAEPFVRDDEDPASIMRDHLLNLTWIQQRVCVRVLAELEELREVVKAAAPELSKLRELVKVAIAEGGG
jgi:hypothetical protein